jgi:alcohol dehydrogenase
MPAPTLRLAVPLPRLLGPGEVIAGEGAFAALRTLPATRVAVIATERTAGGALFRRWFDGSHAYEVRHLKPSWTGEPTLESLDGTVGQLSHYAPDWIVAVGGGSVLDGAKLCWARLEHPLFPAERLSRPFALPRLRAVARFVAVPTTAGTGSENSSSAVFVDTQTGRKIPVVTHDFLPDIVLLEPRLTLGLPLAWTVLTALDALAHALEGRVSALHNPLVDSLAESIAVDLLAALSEFLGNGEILEVRGRLQIAAFHAGQVQNLRLVGLAHAIAHQLGNLHVPHALAVGVFLPLGMTHASTSDPVRRIYDRIARSAGLADSQALIETIRCIPKRAGVDRRIGSWQGVPEQLSSSEASHIAARALDDPIARFLPVRIEVDELAQLIQRAW